jgi:hypothetical protein
MLFLSFAKLEKPARGADGIAKRFSSGWHAITANMHSQLDLRAGKAILNGQEFLGTVNMAREPPLTRATKKRFRQSAIIQRPIIGLI